MANVEFEEDSFDTKRQVSLTNAEPSALVKLIIKSGFAKDEKQANYVLIAVAVCATIAALYIFVNKLS